MSEKYDAYLNNQLGSGNYPLIPGNSQGAQNTYNVNQNNSTENEMIIECEKWGAICNSIGFIFFALLILVIIIGLIIAKKSVIAILILSIVFAVFIIVIFLIYYLSTKHIKLIKNESLNLLTLQKINILNCAKSTLNFDLQNVIPDIHKYEHTHKRHTAEHEVFVITKCFNNNSEIDLNTSNIKDIPIKNLYYVFNGIKQKIYTSLPLRDFLGINPEIENPIKFNINKYMGKSKSNDNPKFGPYEMSKYMKMSDYFYTYFLEEPCCYCGGIICPISIAILSLLFASAPIIMIFVADNVDIVGTIIFLIVLLSAPIVTIIFNIVAIINYSLRIDIIYSNNFDTIFVALLNHNGTSYKKKYIHSINSIERFAFENYEGSFNKSILKVIYKDKTVEYLFRIDKSKFNLEGLLFILNEKISNYKQV